MNDSKFNWLYFYVPAETVEQMKNKCDELKIDFAPVNEKICIKCHEMIFHLRYSDFKTFVETCIFDFIENGNY
jgi:hypothetical protein